MKKEYIVKEHMNSVKESINAVDELTNNRCSTETDMALKLEGFCYQKGSSGSIIIELKKISEAMKEKMADPEYKKHIKTNIK